MKAIPLRNYSITDVKLLWCGKQFVRHAVTEQPKFFRFAPVLFGESFFDTFKDTVIRCSELAEDDSYRSVITFAKKEYLEQLAVVVAQFEELCFFLSMAVDGSGITIETLGVKNRYQASRKRASQISFYRRMKNIFIEQRELLTAQGVASKKIDQFQSSCQTLFDLDEKVSLAKLDRSHAAYDRVAGFNEIWSKVSTIAKASRFIYAPFPNEVNPFVLPPINRKKSKSKSKKAVSTPQDELQDE